MSNSQKIYVQNFVNACTYIQGQMSAWAAKASPDDLESPAHNSHLLEIQADILSYAQAIEEIFEEEGGSAANLPVRSRRAYQWLKFLSAEEYLRQHIQTLGRLYQLSSKASLSRSIKGLRTQIHLYHTGALYKIRERDSFLEVTAHEAFIAAPQEVLEALINITYQKGKPSMAAIIKEFADSEAHFEIRQELEYIGIQQGANAQGEFHNLEEVFKRVNQTYFDGELAQPHLTWNQQLTYRKFGHYQYSTDTLMVSRSLDLPDTPAFILEFVMYHELLHKKLGYNLVNGRRYAHTSAFKGEERQFKKYKKAKDYLEKLSQTIS